MRIIPFQQALRPAIPTVRGNIEYRRLQEQLFRMDEILIVSGVEGSFIERSVDRYVENAKKAKVEVKNHHIKKHQATSVLALRSLILKSMLGETCRGMSLQLAHSPLFQRFCGIGRIDETRVPSKSMIQGFIDIVSEEELSEVLNKLLIATQSDTLELAESTDLESIWIDTTCVKTHIHYPVDWVLLRDATRTLIKAVIVIRKYGLKTRMSNPSNFMSKMNSLCMKMTQCRRKKDSRRVQKETLRLMKKLVTTIRKHAQRHYALLDKEWEKTDLSRKQAENILSRITNVLDLLPEAQRQAHERIIGERQINNEDKILSLYEQATNVIVRGKADAAVEFGNTLYFAEQAEGLIVDWKFFKASAPADSKLMPESVLRIQSSLSLKVRAVGADRGFDSETNQNFLNQHTIFNGITPKNPHQLRERMENSNFRASQKRRASTEARIEIFKNCFLGDILKVKGFENRSLAIAWAVLAHNLWVLARLPTKERALLKLAA